LIVLSGREPDRIIATRNNSSFICGIGDGGLIISPDASSIVAHTSEQPETIRNALWGGILAEIGNARLDGLQRTDVELNNIERIQCR
jgi:hypothetical protein